MNHTFTPLTRSSLDTYFYLYLSCVQRRKLFVGESLNQLFDSSDTTLDFFFFSVPSLLSDRLLPGLEVSLVSGESSAAVNFCF